MPFFGGSRRHMKQMGESELSDYIVMNGTQATLIQGTYGSLNITPKLMSNGSYYIPAKFLADPNFPAAQLAAFTALPRVKLSLHTFKRGF